MLYFFFFCFFKNGIWTFTSIWSILVSTWPYIMVPEVGLESTPPCGMFLCLLDLTHGGVKSGIQVPTYNWSVLMPTWPYVLVSEVGFNLLHSSIFMFTVKIQIHTSSGVFFLFDLICWWCLNCGIHIHTSFDIIFCLIGLYTLVLEVGFNSTPPFGVFFYVQLSIRPNCIGVRSGIGIHTSIWNVHMSVWHLCWHQK